MLSAALIATTPAGTRSGTRDLPPPAARIATVFDDPVPDPDWSDLAAVIEHVVEGERPFSGEIGFDVERVRAIAETVLDRSIDIQASLTNHWILAHGETAPFVMADIEAPVLVLHGTDDPLFPIAHGEALTEELPDASLIRLQGMGHQYPPPHLWDVVVPAVLSHTAQRP